MGDYLLYYATNRNHVGKDQWNPRGYGPKFSDDGMENLRFGRVTVKADDGQVKKFLSAKVGEEQGDGEGLAGYFAKQVTSARIQAFPEALSRDTADVHQPDAKLGSKAMFAELKAYMEKHTDVVAYIHGFNVSWKNAVGSALALQEMLNRRDGGDPAQRCLVVLFTWPSDGMAMPFVSYKSDRSEARGSGYAFGRGLLKLRDFFASLGENRCGQDIHVLCHSMGNYVLQNALRRIIEFNAGSSLPRLFEHIFLCAPDVDDDVLEPDKGLGRLHELCRHVGVYYNRGDLAMYVSDHTKGNPERLGTNGAARPNLVHNKVYQVDCTPLVEGLVEHSYYLWGPVNSDIGLSIDNLPVDAVVRRRRRHPTLANVWSLH